MKIFLVYTGLCILSFIPTYGQDNKTHFKTHVEKKVPIYNLVDSSLYNELDSLIISSHLHMLPNYKDAVYFFDEKKDSISDEYIIRIMLLPTIDVIERYTNNCFKVQGIPFYYLSNSIECFLSKTDKYQNVKYERLDCEDNGVIIEDCYVRENIDSPFWLLKYSNSKLELLYSEFTQIIE